MDIKKICNPEDIRGLVQKPYMHGDKVVATDGSVLICMPPPDNAEYEKCSDDASRMFGKIIDIIKSASDWKAYNHHEITLPDKMRCDCCLGTGKAVRKECHECNGGGTVDAETDYSTYYDLECASCEGIGYLSNLSEDQICPDCDGVGKAFERFALVNISGLPIQAKYFRLISDEPDLQLALIDGRDMLVFKSRRQ